MEEGDPKRVPTRGPRGSVGTGLGGPVPSLEFGTEPTGLVVHAAAVPTLNYRL